ncbi:AraC family transcriptional regulator [Flagellimonas sp. S3867]|uniref:helix-turn-helix domain-containing protein n=1 Tax=Flagellimonas sp. S3867 TaxID=2768063 RepID=UPI001681DFD2|nr:AraC family transcriptional regulator [Flagellimonas sp. S3867]
MNIWEITTISFAFQGLLLSFFFFGKKSRPRYGNILWGIFLMFFSFNLSYNTWYWAYPDSFVTNAFSNVYFVLFSLYGPLFYFYIRNLTTGLKVNLAKDFFHFIPVFIVVLNFIRFYGLSVEKKTLILNKGELNNYLFINNEALYVILSVVLMAYAFFCYKTFKAYYAKDKEIKLWLKLTTVTFSLFGLAWAGYFIIYKIGVLSNSADYFISFSMIAFITMTSYFGFSFTEVFDGKPLNKVFPLIKYQKSGLSKKVLNEYKEKLLLIMESNSLYLDCELKLTDLADKLNVSRHHASQIINECFGMSFYEYVNKYRVEEAEKMLGDEKASDLNISDIAFKAGFNNRMSFYNAFKKYAGVTPSEYRNRSLAS